MDSSYDEIGIEVPASSGALNSPTKEESVEKHMTIAVDLAKNVFEIAVSREPGRVCLRKRLGRTQMMAFFRNYPPSTVLLEACGSSHHFGRQLQALGHRVLLLPPHHTRRYVLRDKTDRADATALLEAHRNEQISPVPLKSLHQQTLASLHRLRSTWVAARTARLNTLRGLLRELGIAIPQGASRVLPALQSALSNPSTPIPIALHPALRRAAEEIGQLELSIRESELELKTLARDLPVAETLQSIPGIGLLSSTALIAFVGSPTRFRSGRHLSSFLGLVPREHSSGSSRHLGSITKRGDPYLRTLLTHGARSALLAARRSPHPSPLQLWALSLQSRKGHNKATVALANKLARIAWAVWSRNQPFQPNRLAA
jgi:transposase